MVQAMKAGKHVVSANKAAIAANYGLLTETARKSGVRFLFEASVAGGIPVLTSITGALQSNNFIEIMGILNGTTNYILTKMTEESLSYEEVLKDAQDKGFAEADPTADVEGIDAANKLSILMALSFDKYVAPEDIPTKGISKITDRDISSAASQNKVIKLIGTARMEDGKLQYCVQPTLLDNTHPLAGSRQRIQRRIYHRRYGRRADVLRQRRRPSAYGKRRMRRYYRYNEESGGLKMTLYKQWIDLMEGQSEETFESFWKKNTVKRKREFTSISYLTKTLTFQELSLNSYQNSKPTRSSSWVFSTV